MGLYKLSLSLCVVLLMELFFFCNSSFANNASYITLSNQIAQNRKLEVVANNVANANSIGFKQDAVLMRKVDLGPKKGQKISFVNAETTYDSGPMGGLKSTGRPLDLAIAEPNHYFKVLTSQGPRYTIDGNMFVNSEYILVNSDGHPYADNGNSPITISDQFQNINITEDGNIYVDGQAIAIIGVFSFDDPNILAKEGNTLYYSAGGDSLAETFKIAAGFLRMSNVNSTEAMARMVELQRSTGATNTLMSNIADLEKSAIGKIMK